ncbi:hypothetical protein TWF569_001696 [Orbilia oligospora]|uniref:Uncharacterized protein n=1 Tax=Orbilia oligospora TaxID=2813651 RepID=A0A7C8IYU7_ORBOL|nr:hypothetical protein TWF102_001018 [Orbilia oligospora]KAF3083572.1 hypothetical protein TWF706_001184 [Orbilia oligospora]KAF3095078.1 hypothetical protein TWF103_010364 [Orbilia oligospora]KAF3123608.1 hypothetical protein TWF569_001696 [Orbilia oligospora]KAF3132228.1 hypothetical protein TWF703_007346 [Orbilia oligospora]
MKLQHLSFSTSLLITANYPLASTSPAILPRAEVVEGVPHSLNFGNPITISASLSLGVPSSPSKGLLPPAPPLLTSIIPTFSPSALTTSLLNKPSPPSSSPESITPTHINPSPPPSPSSFDDSNNPTSVIWISHTDPQITSLHPAKSTWIQDDYPPQPPTNTSSNHLPTSFLQDNHNITCRNFPSQQSLTICSPTLLVFLFLLFYTGILRVVLYLQEISARQVLELGEVLMGHRDASGGYAWLRNGSWKIRQQPELPGVAMMGLEDMERIGGDGSGGGRGYGTMNGDNSGADLAGHERIWLQDLDYRRKGIRKGNNTPEEVDTSITGFNKSKGKLRVDEEGEEGGGRRELTDDQKKELERKRREMVRKTHMRMLDDTKPKRVFYGAVIVAGTVGIVFVILGSLVGVLCKQILRMGRCPFEEV